MAWSSSRPGGFDGAGHHQGGVLADVAEPGGFQGLPQPLGGGRGPGEPGRAGGGFLLGAGPGAVRGHWR